MTRPHSWLYAKETQVEGLDTLADHLVMEAGRVADSPLGLQASQPDVHAAESSWKLPGWQLERRTKAGEDPVGLQASQLDVHVAASGKLLGWHLERRTKSSEDHSQNRRLTDGRESPYGRCKSQEYQPATLQAGPQHMHQWQKMG